MKMPENEISYYDPVQVHPFHHPAAATSIMQHHTGASPTGPYPSLQFPSAFVAFQTSPAVAHVPTANTANLLEHHAHLHRQQQQQQQQQAAAFSNQAAGLESNANALHFKCENGKMSKFMQPTAATAAEQSLFNPRPLSSQTDHRQHLHQTPQSHEAAAAAAASRYLWDPAAVAAANFHHPSAHG